MRPFFSRISLIAVFSFSLSGHLYAQRHSPMTTWSGCYRTAVPPLTEAPPLNSGMPYNAMIGYIIMDSVCKTFQAHSIDSIIQSCTNYDSLNYLLKYLYAAADYSPILFTQYCWYGDLINTTYKSQPGWLYGAAKKRIQQLLLNNSTLCNPSYITFGANTIYHIIITSINTGIDSLSGFWGKPSQLECISATVLNVFKGQQWLSCNNPTNNTIKNKSLRYNIMADSTGSCINFSFDPLMCCQMPISGDFPLTNGMTHRVLDNKGNPLRNYGDFTWQVDSEYIVFLNNEVDYDGTYDYFRLQPMRGYEPQGGIYPICNGMVLDSANYFGLGTSVPLNKFENMLTQTISSFEQ